MTHRRTTFILNEELYRAVKRKAVDRGRPMRVLVEEALRAYLGLGAKPNRGKVPQFGVYKMKVIGSLGRENIYENHPSRKVR